MAKANTFVIGNIGSRLAKLLVGPPFSYYFFADSTYLFAKPLPDDASFAQKNFHCQFFGSIFLRLQQYPKFLDLSGPQWKWLVTATEVSSLSIIFSFLSVHSTTGTRICTVTQVVPNRLPKAPLLS